MPHFTLHRNYTLRTLRGLSFQFVKGEPLFIPPFCVPEAVAIGAIPVDEDIDVIEKEYVPPPPMTMDERKEKLHVAFEALIKRQDRGDFTASGLPHVKKIADITGFELTTKERDQFWQEYLQKLQEETTQ